MIENFRIPIICGLVLGGAYCLPFAAYPIVLKYTERSPTHFGFEHVEAAIDGNSRVYEAERWWAGQWRVSPEFHDSYRQRDPLGISKIPLHNPYSFSCPSGHVYNGRYVSPTPEASVGTSAPRGEGDVSRGVSDAQLLPTGEKSVEQD